MSDLHALTAELLAFRDARDWRQFHSLRNLIVSLNLEAAELLELTQWKSDAEIAALPAVSTCWRRPGPNWARTGRSTRSPRRAVRAPNTPS